MGKEGRSWRCRAKEGRSWRCRGKEERSWRCRGKEGRSWKCRGCGLSLSIKEVTEARLVLGHIKFLWKSGAGSVWDLAVFGSRLFPAPRGNVLDAAVVRVTGMGSNNGTPATGS